MSEEEDADRLELLLDRVDGLRERHEHANLGTPLIARGARWTFAIGPSAYFLTRRGCCAG